MWPWGALHALIGLCDWCMTELDNRQASEQRILDGMANLLQAHSQDRRDQLAAMLVIQHKLDQRVEYLAATLEDMRRNQAGNLERLSDRLHERNQLGDQRYTEFVTRIQDCEARMAVLETEIDTIKLLLADLTREMDTDGG